jgi:hypothetical protein
MRALAVIRPDDWNLPFFIHVLGAFVLIGALVTAASYLFAARRDGSLELTRTGFRTLLIIALPALIATRLAADWLADKEGLEDVTDDLTWTTAGYIATDIGFVVLIVATVAAGLAVRRAGRVEATGGGSGGLALAAWLSTLLVVAYAVVIWMMATKPD